MKQQNHELTTGPFTSHEQRRGALLMALASTWIFLAVSPAVASTAYIRGVCVLPFGGCDETGLPPFSVSAASPSWPGPGQSEVSGSGEWGTSASHSYASGLGGDARASIVTYDEIHFRNAAGTDGDVVWAEISYELSVAAVTRTPPNSAAVSNVSLVPRTNWVGFSAPTLRYSTDTGWATPSRYTYTFWWNTDTNANPQRPLGLEVFLYNESKSMWSAGYDPGYGLPSSDSIATATWSLSVITPGGSFVSASGHSYSAVPLPGAGVLFGSALLILRGVNRKRRNPA